MNRKVHLGSVILLLVAAVGTAGFEIREYRQDKQASELLYADSGAKQAFTQAARKASGREGLETASVHAMAGRPKPGWHS
jgi:hypothetical protein